MKLDMNAVLQTTSVINLGTLISVSWTLMMNVYQRVYIMVTKLSGQKYLLLDK